MKNENSTEGKLNASMRTTISKCCDVWPKNISTLFLSSPVKKVMLIFPLQVNWKNSFNSWCHLNFSKAAVCWMDISSGYISRAVVCIGRPTAEQLQSRAI